MTSDKWMGVHTGGAHYLDHLGVLCSELEIPLVLSDPDTYQVAQDLYPWTSVEYCDLPELTLDFLACRADVIFESGHHFTAQLIPLWELMYGKKMRVVYCPHGNSDKEEKTRKDLSLIYGDFMKELLQKTGELKRLEKTVTTGNYRALYYQKHQKWYDDRLDLLLRDRIRSDRKTVFYAPTWPKQESRLSHLRQGIKVIEEVGDVFNLLIRWHPFLDDLYPVESEKLKHLSERNPGIVNLSTFPSIYPILHRTDFYLGDFSSIGYDFLYFNKPLFFADRFEGEIKRCGVTLQEESHWGEAILSFQDDLGWAQKREQQLTKVFGEYRSFEAIKKDLKEALSNDRASWI